VIMSDTSFETNKDKLQSASTKIRFWRLILDQISPQWSIFFQILFQPWAIVCILLSIGALFCSYDNKDKNLTLLLSIAASIFTSVVGALYYDRYKDISGNTVLVKKGAGAVRSLFLIVEKIKNVSLRANKSKNIEEIENLINLIEKDVSNSINEWTDVLPNIETAYMDVIFSSIQKAESSLSDEINKNYELQKQLIDAQKNFAEAEEAKNKDKETIDTYRKQKEKYEIAVKEISERMIKLEDLVNKLKIEKEIAISAGTSGTSGTAAQQLQQAFTSGSSGSSGISQPTNALAAYVRRRTMMKQEELDRLTMPICKECGAAYRAQAIGDTGLCNKCKQAIRSGN